MSVTYCSNCDAPLPKYAKFCTTCGEVPPSPLNHDVSETITQRVRPHSAQKEDSRYLSDISTASLGLLVNQADEFDEDDTKEPADDTDDDDVDDSRRGTNWRTDVDTRTRPLVTSRPMPALLPSDRTPLPSDYVMLSEQEPRRKLPSLFFLVSIFVIFALLLGGVSGIVMALNRGIHPASRGIFSLQVTPTNAASGTTITLRGTNFSPSVHIGLTRDVAVPILDTGGKNIISANANGSFTDTVIVDPSWQAGPHIIRAEDARLHKTASFTIMVAGQSSSLRPAHLLLSTSMLDLGSGDQATNTLKSITLTNAGGGQISWQSTSTQPWLLMSPKSGTFSNGQSVSVTIGAARSQLKPGSYAAALTFLSNAGQTTIPVKMITTLLQAGHEPVLELMPPVLAFSGTDGGASPSAQTVTINNPGVLPLQWSAAVNGGSGGNGWLSVSPPSGQIAQGGSQPVSITINTSTVLPGTYSAWITFTGSGEGTVKDSPQSIYVSLTVVPQCALQVSPGNLAFTGVALQPAPVAKTMSLGVTPACSGQLLWSASASTNNGGHWLSLQTSSGVTPASPSVAVNPSGLNPGIYTGTIIFSSTAGTLTVPVSFTLTQSTTPAVVTTPSTMSMNAINGQMSSATQTLTITNSGGAALTWHTTATTSSGGSWLTTSPGSGTLAPHQSVTVTVRTSIIAGLAPNIYNGTITITGTDSAGNAVAGSPQTLPIIFTVQTPCTISVAPGNLNFIGIVGQSNPTPQTATIAAGGTCTHTLNWTASSSGGSWLSTASTSGTVNLAAPASIPINVSLAGLSITNYSGTVTITATDSFTHQQVGTPQSISIALIVQPACTLQTPSISTANFTTEAGTNPSSQNFTIGVAGTCNGSVTITPTVTGGNWLAVTPTSATISGGSGSATFTLTVTSASLPVGTVPDGVSLAASLGGKALASSPQSVNVSLDVVAAPSLSVSPYPGTVSFNVTTGTASQPVTIGNTGGEPLNWTATLPGNAPSFVSLSAGSGTNLAGGTNTSVDVNVDATGVPGGASYTTSVIISATDPLTGKAVTGSSVTVNIVINVAAPFMHIDTNTLSFTTTVGTNPAPQSITLSNTGGDGLSWTVGTPSQSWLSVNVNNGTDTSGGSSTISFSVNITGLATGPYSATVIITPSSGSPITLTVNLTVN